MTPTIERLDCTKHNRLAFACGKEPLDRFLHETAHQAFQKNIAATYVAVDPNEPAKIIGYYSVCSFQIDAGEIDIVERKRRRLPAGRLLPATLIGRLAVHSEHQGKGLGADLLFDALVRSYIAGRQIASTAIVIDAMDEGVVGFYEQYGFRRCAPESLKMYIMMHTVGQLEIVQRRVAEAAHAAEEAS